jgi:hypothetical protein
MPNARPTQPGYYWARRAAGGDWQPTKVDEVGPDWQWMWLLMFGDEYWYGTDEGIEWGPGVGDGLG